MFVLVSYVHLCTCFEVSRLQKMANSGQDSNNRKGPTTIKADHFTYQPIFRKRIVIQMYYRRQSTDSVQRPILRESRNSSSIGMFDGHKKSRTPILGAAFLNKILAVSYSHMGKPHTTIGAERFHF